MTTFAGVALYSVAVDPANPARVYVGATSLYPAPSRVYTVGGGTTPTVFLAKFDATLSQVIYCTYLWTGAVSAIALDSAGDVYLAGGDYTGSNGMVMKVGGTDSTVLYSTPLSGVVPNAIVIDANDNAAIAGTPPRCPSPRAHTNPLSPALAPTRSICSTPSPLG